MQRDVLLDIQSLQTVFHSGEQNIIAVNDISFKIYKGETLGIVGESGSGKSVTALSIMQLLPQNGQTVRGRAFFSSPGGDVVDLLSLKEQAIRRHRGSSISMIFQEPMTSLNPVFTCGSQVAETIALHLKYNISSAREKTLSLFERVQLADPVRVFNSFPHQLSGGQKQRVMIAMAMSCNPSLLIADEPTTALDVTVQHHILELMQQLQQENDMGMIFITHDLGVVAEVADHIAVMYEGRIVEQGSTEEIFSDPKHPYTKGLLACLPPLEIKLRRLPTVQDFLTGQKDASAAGQPSPEVFLNQVSEKEMQDRFNLLQQSAPALSVKNLQVWFSGKRTWRKDERFVKAVDDVSFDVYPGETLGLVGESGCGKTTLGRSILQLVRPFSGAVLYEGKNLGTLSEKELRNVRKELQFIFQDPYASLNPRMTVGYAIMEPMVMHHLHRNDAERKNKVMELLEKVHLPAGSYTRFPHEFSGGQRQRICIARALALNPRFIICDEPVSSLDVSVQAQVLNLLLQLREEFGFTSIFISHDLSVVKFMSDRMMVMNEGKIVEMGRATEVYNKPSSEYTKRLINAVPKGTIDHILLRRKMRSGYLERSAD